MKIIKIVVHYVAQNGGFITSIGKVVKISWHLVTSSGLNSLCQEIQRSYRSKQVELIQNQRRQTICVAAHKRTIGILTAPHTLYVAHMLEYTINQLGFQSHVITEPPRGGYGTDIYIVLCPQTFLRLPKFMIAFQMEQSMSKRWFTENYLKTLKNSLAILDYSRTNISFLQKQGIPFINIFYLPIHRIPNYREFLSERGFSVVSHAKKKYDVLFYGDTHNERRQAMLALLSERFSVTIISDTFGQKLYEQLAQAKVIVNIHYYENALLETTRICECLSLGLTVVSEASIDRHEYPEFEDCVSYFDIGDTEGLIAAVNDALISANKNEQLGTSGERTESVLTSDANFYLMRFLLANNLIDFDLLVNTSRSIPKFESGKICLSLPETFDRRASFLSMGLDGYEIFDGLRHTRGWTGCGLSYKYLIWRAKMAGLPRITICEDDVVISENNEKELPIVEEYLESIDGEWDVFVGLIAHVHPDVEISRVVEYRGLMFAHLNKMTSMVFNIYNHSIYDLIISWDESNEDTRANTIDRYLERNEQIRVIAPIPFIVSHSDEENSTLWGIKNERYSDLIKTSEALLQAKVKAFRDAINVIERTQ